MTMIQSIRRFASLVANEPVAIDRGEWGIYLTHPYPYICVPKNPLESDDGDKAFRRDFVSRCPMAQGFSNITLSILHELGHHFNRDSFDESEYENEVDHFSLPCERVATDWAINWLKNANNRKIAKQFEKELFGY